MVINCWNRSLELKPEQPLVHKNLAELYLSQSRFDKAVTHFTKLLDITPESVTVLNNLAWLLAVYNNADFHDPQKAVELAERACELTDHTKPDLLDTLAVAYAVAGRFPEAIETAKKAAALARSAGLTETVNQIQHHLSIFENSRAYTEQMPVRQDTTE
jgi:tetratricopeptide (TPR) repeat protein